MSDEQPPFYNYLGHPVGADEMTDDQRAVLAASEATVDTRIGDETGIYTGIEDVLADLTRRGWWVEIKTPFSPGGTPNGGLYWAGLTPLSTTGWNGKPDFQVGDVSLRGALWRATLLMMLAERTTP